MLQKYENCVYNYVDGNVILPFAFKLIKREETAKKKKRLTQNMISKETIN